MNCLAISLSIIFEIVIRDWCINEILFRDEVTCSCFKYDGDLQAAIQ